MDTVPMSPRAKAMYDKVCADLETVDERKPGVIAGLHNEIAIFERVYDMTSAEMLRHVESGELEETHEICTWIMQVELLDHVTSSD